MSTSTVHPVRLLADGTLHNRLLAALPALDYARIQKHLHTNTGSIGFTHQAHGTPVTDVYFPNGGVFSVTNEMRDGALVEVATVGIEGMLGIGVFLGDAARRVQRCCRWLQHTQDRVGSSEFLLKQDFFAIMLVVQRPTVTLVMGKLRTQA